MALFPHGDYPDPAELRSVELFADLSDDELSGVARLATRRELTAGDLLIDQGRVGDSFFVISEGRALVYIGDDFVASVGSRSAVGETALVEHRPRNASVIAETDMVVAEFGVNEFHKLLDRYPTARLRIMELLNSRVRENLERRGQS